MRVALLLLLLLYELSVVALPVFARIPVRSAAAIVPTRLRAAPEHRSESLMRLPEGATIMIHGRPKNGWYLARRGELEGYVRTGDVATDPVIPASDAQPSELIDDPTVVGLEQRAGGRGRVRERRGAQIERTAPGLGETITTRISISGKVRAECPVAAVMPRGERVIRRAAQRRLRRSPLAGRYRLGVRQAPRRPSKDRHENRGARDRDSGSWRRRELIEIIYAAADKYGQSREDMLRVARCESDLVPSAINGRAGRTDSSSSSREPGWEHRSASTTSSIPAPTLTPQPGCGRRAGAGNGCASRRDGRKTARRQGRAQSSSTRGRRVAK
jgi:hypothetical protein